MDQDTHGSLIYVGGLWVQQGTHNASKSYSVVAARAAKSRSQSIAKRAASAKRADDPMGSLKKVSAVLDQVAYWTGVGTFGAIVAGGGPEDPVTDVIAAVLGYASMVSANAAVLTGCIAYRFDSQCTAQAITVVFGDMFTSIGGPLPGAIFGILTSSAWLLAGERS